MFFSPTRKHSLVSLLGTVVQSLSLLKPIVALLVAVLLMSSLGCVGIVNSSRSVPHVSAQGKSTGVLSCSLKLNVIPLNAEVFGMMGLILPIIPIWHNHAQDHFWVLLTLNSTDGAIRFDTKDIVLVTEEDRHLVAVSMSGPHPVQKGRHTSLEALLDMKNPSYIVDSLIISEEVLVGLMFQTPTLPPDRQFKVIIDRTQRHDCAHDPILISFERRQSREFYFSILDPVTIRKEWVIENP